MCGFKMMGCSRVSSICVWIVSLLLVRIKQLYKKSSLLCFCKFLCLIDPKDQTKLQRKFYMLFSVSFWIYFCIFDLFIIFWWKDLVYDNFLPLKFQIWFFGPLSYGESYSSFFSVCLSIISSAFLSGMVCYFLQTFCTMVDNWNI